MALRSFYAAKKQGAELWYLGGDDLAGVAQFTEDLQKAKIWNTPGTVKGQITKVFRNLGITMDLVELCVSTVTVIPQTERLTKRVAELDATAQLRDAQHREYRKRTLEAQLRRTQQELKDLG